MAGDFLRDYEILGRVGAGGMGVVLQARDIRLHRVVALKFLPHDMYGGEADKESLLKEARAISALDHPNICTVYGLEENEDGQLFMAMAYYDGGTLAGKIANGPISLSEAVELLRGIVSGLGAAHAHNILHRDIKPSNILLTRKGVPKIVDFGLSRAISGDSRTLSLTISGTAAYMSPEQLCGEAIDQRADIWAIGVTAVEILSGHHPFRRDTLPAVAHSICVDPPEIPGDLPLSLQRILYRCLAKTPELRYLSCEELLQDLAALDPGSISGSGGAVDTASLHPPKVSQRKALSNAVAAASGGVVRESSRKGWVVAGAALLLLVLAVIVFPVPREHVRGLLFGPKEKHIAVLPFDSGDAATAPLAAGLMDSMTAALSNLDAGGQSLWVIPAAVVRSGNLSDPVAAYKQLGATLVVKGKLERDGQRVAIDLDLINAETLRQVGAVSAANENGDLAAAEEDAVTQLGHLLNVSGGRDAVARSGSSSVPAAYDLYLEALSYLQRFDKPQNLDLAVDRLQKAIAQDPEFALAYAKLGEAYRLKYKAGRDPKWMQEALENCERALKLNPELPSAYVTLGSLHTLTGHNELALAEFQKAAALDARNADAAIGVAWSYEQAARLDEAEAEYKRAAALNASDWSNRNELALFYDRHGRYADAIEQVKQAIASSPDNPMLYFNLGGFYLDSGNAAWFPLAEDALRKSLALAATNGAYGNLAMLYLHEKRYAEAAAASEKAIALDTQQILSWRFAELAYRWLGNRQRADAALNQIENVARAQTAMNPRNAQDQSWLGLAYAKKGLCGQANPHIDAALSLAPGDSQVVVNAVEAYNLCADETSAEKLIKKARQNGVSFADLQLDPDMQSLLARVKAH
ncbi:protein kinase [Alloacidobacterium dinghuense]|uniref:Protein kinase n=1 Tax=Alloacidobacterium dinghuense TaxID=2763107 RepID=A0A7G8BIP7_9BACT|nr:serine/threonine-protein kinase [Alloacidobacterium dinghuense]QNI32417.1 protein kinase [Alloacidobacterium dinghuense]